MNERCKKMIVKPKTRGFICTTAHPEGCKRSVEKQIEYVKSNPTFEGAKRILVIGASTGFGLSSRISLAFGTNAATIGISYEKLSNDKKTATPGWYNTAAFETFAHEQGLYAKSINGDAFSDEIKQKTIEMIKNDLGTVDMVIYSLASPRRTDPITAEVYGSVLKPIHKAFTSKTIDIMTRNLSDITIEPATDEEVKGTIKVMGGEDWRLWIEALSDAGVLAQGAITIAYSYIGPVLTFPIYRDGTIGNAKEHLEQTAIDLTNEMKELELKAYVSVNKALVTQASSAIPVVPLYISLLYKIMKDKGIHEGCIEQMYRMFTEKIYKNGFIVDERNRLRVDDWEMREDVQKPVAMLWENIDGEILKNHSDLDGYEREFFHLFGFGYDEVDYDADVEIEVRIPSIV